MLRGQLAAGAQNKIGLEILIFKPKRSISSIYECLLCAWHHWEKKYFLLSESASSMRTGSLNSTELRQNRTSPLGRTVRWKIHLFLRRDFLR